MKTFYFSLSATDITSCGGPIYFPKDLRVVPIVALDEADASVRVRDYVLNDERYPTGRYEYELIATDAADGGGKVDEPMAEDSAGPIKLRYDLDLRTEDEASGVRVGGLDTPANIIDEISREMAAIGQQAAQNGVSAESKAEAFDAMAEAAGEDEAPAGGDPNDEAASEDMVPALRGSGVVVREPGLMGALRGWKFPEWVEAHYPKIEGVGETTGLPLGGRDERLDTAGRETLLRALTGDRELLRLIWTHLAKTRNRLPEVKGVPAARLQRNEVALLRPVGVVTSITIPLERMRRHYEGFHEGETRRRAEELREALRLTLRYLLTEAGWELDE